jgi:NADH dehydrogenase
MADTKVVITGAFSYTGKYATRLLLRRGYKVHTLTFHPGRQNEFGSQVEAFPYSFDRPDQLRESLRGASILINTYWVRFPSGVLTFEAAVRNTGTLIEAAKTAGIRRMVHVSIAKPSLESPLGYYRGKAQIEEMVVKSGLAYNILRPTVIFGPEDILINNIAWFARSFPVFAIPGDGRYRLRPIFVEDLAALILRGAESPRNEVVDAVGPESFAFEELVEKIAGSVGKSPRFVHVPPRVAYLATRLMGGFVGDVILTWEEYKGLMEGLLAPEGPSAGQTQLTAWLAKNGGSLGRAYTSEVARHFAPSARGA